MQTYSIIQMLYIAHRLRVIWRKRRSGNWSLSVMYIGEKDITQSGPLKELVSTPTPIPDNGNNSSLKNVVYSDMLQTTDSAQHCIHVMSRPLSDI
jgi:hypothetical protein